MHDLIPLPTAAELASSIARHPAGTYLSRVNLTEGCVRCAEFGVRHDGDHDYGDESDVEPEFVWRVPEGAVEEMQKVVDIRKQVHVPLCEAHDVDIRRWKDALTSTLHLLDAGNVKQATLTVEHVVDQMMRSGR
jgi:hypothetical protein